MAKYIKPDYSEQWASAGDKVTPDSVKIQTGHIVEKPNYEYMNWLQNRQDTAIAYSLQMGVVEWDNTTQYQYTLNSHASYVQRNGVVYKAIQTGINKDPLIETAYWSIAFDDKGSAATVQANLNTHINKYGTLTGLTNTTTARTNLDVYSKAEAAQKNGDSTKLFSVADGTAGNEAVNFQQLVTKADKNGNSAEVFSVATATLSAHAVRKDQFDAKTGIATETGAGIVEKATQAELNVGTVDVWPDAATLFNGFAKSETDNGYVKLPEWLGGFILQWGKYTTGDLPDGGQHEFTVVFPLAFNLDVFSVILTPYSPSGGANAFTANVRDYDSVLGFIAVLQEFAGVSQGANAGFLWLAIGK